MSKCRCLVALALLAPAAVSIADSASRAPVHGRHAMVATTDRYASEVGVSILQQGGSAADAAVAVGFALAVVHPEAGNLGGGGFLVIHDAKTGREFSLDFRETAPSSAREDMFQDSEGKVLEELSRSGYLASGIPGTVAGLYRTWREFGRLSWKELLQPALRLAAEGFRVSDELARALRSEKELLSRFAESRRIFLRNGDFYREGEIFRQPELARTLELIGTQGSDAFYQGEIAGRIAADMQANGGLITREDLQNYQVKLREPVRGTYRDCEIISMGPPSSGGVILIEMLNMIEPFPVAGLGFNSSASIHLKVEVMRRAFADRARFLGDPDFVDLPVAGLGSKEYARQRTRDIRDGYATPSRFVSEGEPAGFEPDSTTHFSIVDAEGNAVAFTTTLNGGFGSGVTIPGTGFLMNNEMDDFTSRPGVPNMFGLIQGEANAVGPEKRPLSAMTPTLVKKDGRLFMVLGSPGGPTIINTVFQIILNVVDHGMDIQEAVDAIRVHHQWLPDELVAERGGVPRDVEQALAGRGHLLRYRDRIGDAHSILIDPETGLRLGAADPRQNGVALGF